jgi:hypothetical protein
MEIEEVMSKKSNDELLDIIVLKAYTYEEFAIIAAKNELKRRKISGIDKLIEIKIDANFEILESLSNEELAKRVAQWKSIEKKSEKEVRHILFHSKIPANRVNEILVEAKEVSNSARGSILNNSDMFFGLLSLCAGLFSCYLMYVNAMPKQSYLFSLCAIVYGAVHIHQAANDD